MSLNIEMARHIRELAGRVSMRNPLLVMEVTLAWENWYDIS
jgi:hypothetical protein